MSERNTELASEGVVTIDEAKTFLKIGRATLYRMLDEGQLPSVKIRGRRMIPKRAAVEMISSQLPETVPAA